MSLKYNSEKFFSAVLQWFGEGFPVVNVVHHIKTNLYKDQNGKLSL